MRRPPLPWITPALVASALSLCACTEFTAPRGEDPAELGQPPAKPGPQKAKDEGATVSASHILIAYKGARRASPKVTRSKAEAQELAGKLAAQLKTPGVEFEDLAKDNSDDSGSGPNGGKLGSFSRETMTKKFSDAAFALAVGQISEPVETEFGFHIIKRTQ